jgi:hypothetical protein
VSGVDPKTGRKVEIDIEPDSRKGAFEIARRERAVFPKSGHPRRGRSVCKMVQTLPSIGLSEKASTSEVAAAHPGRS